MTNRNSCQFKQILIDIETYNTLKDLGKAGDSFNDVLKKLIKQVMEGGNF